MLFLVGGPLLTVIVLGVLGFRNGKWAVQAEQDKFSKVLTVPVTLEGVRFVRPSERVFYGLALQDPKINQTAIYCPVVSIIRGSGNSRIERIKNHAAFNLRPTEPLGKRDTWGEVTIPSIFVRYSSLPRLKFLVNEFLQKMSTEQGQNITLFRIGEILACYSDADFQQKFDQGLGATRKERWERAKSLLADEQQTDTKTFETIDASTTSVQRWIDKYNKQLLGAKLTSVIGLYCDTPMNRSVDLEFRFAEIPAEFPVLFSWEFQRKDATKPGGLSRLVLRSVKSQFPCSFASTFCPFFFIAGTESWMTGTIAAETTFSDATPSGETLLKFDDFHLKHCDLVPLARRVTPRSVSGTVADFHLESAQVRQGVFTGKGLLFLVDATLEKQFLARLAETIPLRFDPPSALANQYKNDEVPFNQLAVSFDFRSEGIVFDSSYPKKIIAFFRNDKVEYGVYLSESSDQKVVPYPNLVTALAMQPDTVPFWSPVYRDAINHLPVEP